MFGSCVRTLAVILFSDFLTLCVFGYYSAGLRSSSFRNGRLLARNEGQRRERGRDRQTDKQRQRQTDKDMIQWQTDRRTMSINHKFMTREKPQGVEPGSVYLSAEHFSSKPNWPTIRSSFDHHCRTWISLDHCQVDHCHICPVLHLATSTLDQCHTWPPTRLTTAIQDHQHAWPMPHWTTNTFNQCHTWPSIRLTNATLDHQYV